MSFNETFEKVKNTLIGLLKNKKVNIMPESSASDIAEWDSIFHIQFIIALEENFGIKFTSIEMTSFNDIKELCELIDHKSGNNSIA
jgi:acyl carrier protein